MVIIKLMVNYGKISFFQRLFDVMVILIIPPIKFGCYIFTLHEAPLLRLHLLISFTSFIYIVFYEKKSLFGVEVLICLILMKKLFRTGLSWMILPTWSSCVTSLLEPKFFRKLSLFELMNLNGIELIEFSFSLLELIHLRPNLFICVELL